MVEDKPTPGASPVDGRYRHALHLAKLPDCPPSECVPAEGVAYRFVLSPLDQKSFEPGKAARNPEGAGCSAWGLSMYRNEQKARRAHARNVETYGEAWRLNNGTHLAVGTLIAAHGMTTEKKRQTSKFNLHEFLNSNLAAAFEIVDALPSADASAEPES